MSHIHKDFSWLGAIPTHWQVLNLRQILTTCSEKNHPDMPLLSVVREKGVIVRNIDDKNHNYVPDDLSNYKLVKRGQFAVNKMKAWQGSYGVSQHDGIVSPAYFVFNINHDMNHDFFDKAIRSKIYVNYFGQASDGIRVGQWDLSMKRLRDIPFCLPPREEQEQIVRFLDWKVSAIDKLIATYKKEITCLEELSQAQIDTTISHLASNPSILKKLKRITACNRSTLDESTPYDYLFRYVDISSVDAKHGITHYEKTVFGKSPSRARRIVHKDDLIVSTVRTYLRAIAKIEDDDNVIVSTGFAVITPQNVDSGYLECLFKSNLFCDEVVRRSIGVSYPSINTSALMDISVPIPSFDTQIDIGKRLTAQRKKINRYIEYKKQQISNLNELKTRLISDAVTGKIDVRSIKLPNFAKEE